MKLNTLLAFALIILTNAGLSQQMVTGPKVPGNDTSMGDLIDGQKMTGFRQSLQFPLGFLTKHNSFLKSTPTVKLDSILIHSYQAGTDRWVITNKQIFRYDTDYRLTEIAATSGIYSGSTKPETARFRYNPAGLVESVNIFNPAVSEAADLYRFSYTYDDTGRLLTAYSYYPENGDWFINVGKKYKYDDAGNVSEIFSEENWWIYWTSLHKYSYNTSGKLFLYVNDFYSILTTYKWNTNGNLEELHYTSWYQDRDQTYQYDADGIRTKATKIYSTRQWNGNEYTLQDKSSETYTYSDINSNTLVAFDLSLLDLGNELDAVKYIPEKLVSAIDYYQEYSNGSANVSPYLKAEYFYSPVMGAYGKTTGADADLSNAFSVYPNPATGQVRFSWNDGHGLLQLSIYQLTGACLLTREISANEPVSLDRLSKGVYIYKLSDGSKCLQTGKLVIN